MNNQDYKLKIAFGTPSHGWLPMVFHWQDFQLELDISDVPADPIVQLLDTLIQLHKGVTIPDEILWHLEPECYYLQVEQMLHHYRVLVSTSADFNSSKTLVQEFSGDYQQIILPLYRGLKEFCSHAYKAPDWEEVDLSRLSLLTELVSKNK